jgi:hypothetical protein
MTDSTTRRAEEIREDTGCSWERACHLAELERDFPHVPAEWRDYARQNGWDARDVARAATSYGAKHGLPREPGEDHYGLS